MAPSMANSVDLLRLIEAMHGQLAVIVPTGSPGASCQTVGIWLYSALSSMTTQYRSLGEE